MWGAGMRLHDVSKSAEGSSDVLSVAQLKKLQAVLLMMLTDLKQICDENGIKFVMIGGTGIGAMRHKGFIPWDDDVDIAMPRRDYEKLLKIIRAEYNEKYSVSDARDGDNFGKIIPKFRLNKTTYRTIADAEKEDCGVRIDIFVIENTYNSSLLRNAHGVMCMLFGFALSCRRLYQNKYMHDSKLNHMSFRIKALIGSVLSFASLNTWARWTDWCYSLCKNDSSKFVTVPSDGPHYFKGIIEREKICCTADVLFEGQKMWIPSGVHEYLSRIYGDYMQLPSESKRVRATFSEFDLGKYDTEMEPK